MLSQKKQTHLETQLINLTNKIKTINCNILRWNLIPYIRGVKKSKIITAKQFENFEGSGFNF